jgi:putative ABC transport system permease protein
MGFGELRRPGDAGAHVDIDASWSLISPEYLPTLGIPIVRGRNFTRADRGDVFAHAIVNETFARRTWPNADPVGQSLVTGDFRPGHADSLSTVTIVGLARDTMTHHIGEPPSSVIYMPLGERAWMHPHFFIARQPGLSSAAVGPALRQTLAAFDRSLPLVDFTPLQQLAGLSLLPQRIAAGFAGVLGLLTLVLAAMGLYGLTAFMVASRTREIGVRVALGASRARVLRLMIRQASRTAAIGAAAGLVIAFGAAKLLASVIYGMPPADPLALAATVAIVVGVAFVATYVPARRAATIDPVAALRTE